MSASRRRARAAAVLVAAAGLAAQALAGEVAKKPPVRRVPPPALAFGVFSRTGLPLSDVTWTGDRFLYATETQGAFSVSGPTGSPVTPFATIPSEVEEVRCRPSPGTHGWPAGVVFCHAPHGVVYRLGADGSTSVFATLPDNDGQDGAMVFDTAGLYGYAMLVTTGGPGGDGGAVYALGPDASRRTVGTFPGPGGADNLELAPAEFGTASNQLLIAVDHDDGAGGTAGRVLAMSPAGAVRTLVNFKEGINPIAVVGRGDAPRGAAAPGFYVTDTNSATVYLLPAAALARYPNAVVVGAEKTAHFWLVRAGKTTFAQLRLKNNLEATSGTWNLEGAEWVA